MSEPAGRRRNDPTKQKHRTQAESGFCHARRSAGTPVSCPVLALHVFQESHMRRLQTKQCEAWRCRREQYLRESGRHVDSIREGYAAADEATNWTVVVGGRGRGPLKRDLGTRLFLVKPSLDHRARCKESSAPAACGTFPAVPR